MSQSEIDQYKKALHDIMMEKVKGPMAYDNFDIGYLQRRWELNENLKNINLAAVIDDYVKDGIVVYTDSSKNTLEFSEAYKNEHPMLFPKWL